LRAPRRSSDIQGESAGQELRQTKSLAGAIGRLAMDGSIGLGKLGDALPATAAGRGGPAADGVGHAGYFDDLAIGFTRRGGYHMGNGRGLGAPALRVGGI